MYIHLDNSPGFQVAVPGSTVAPGQAVVLARDDEETGRSRAERARDETALNRATESAESTAEARRGSQEDAEARLLQALQRRDREVRAHEQAHLAAAGGHARGGPVYEFQRGPDGRQYAVGGRLSLDVTPVPGDPQATLRKAEAVRRSALAPADPSAQDRQVAMQASSVAQQARAEIAREEAARDDISRAEESGVETEQALRRRLAAAAGGEDAPESTLDLTA